MKLSTLIDRFASYYAAKTFITSEGGTLTFGQVNGRANRLANGLLRLGLKPGERVASLNRNCHQHVEIFFANAKCGAVRVQLNPRLTAGELARQINDCEARAIIADAESLDKIISARSRLSTVEHVISLAGAPSPDIIDYEALLADSRPDDPGTGADEDALGCLWYTAGTTGEPKAVMLPVRSDMAVCRNLLLDMLPHLSSQDTLMPLQPLYHGAGLFILPCWVRGAALRLVADFSPETAFPIIERERVTVIKTVPTVLGRMIDHPDVGKYDLSSIHTIAYGGSPMPVEKIKKALRIFGPVLTQTYAQAEALATATVLRREEYKLRGTPGEVARLASAGRPYTLAGVRVVDDNGADVPTGETGEVIVSGDHIMTGYWKHPEKTAEKLRNGWVYTGDIGRWDEDGYLYLVDRKGEMIVSGGLNVYPGEVEQVLYRHPAVLEAAVIGVPDENWGEAVRAVVVLRPGAKATGEEIISFCGQHLAGYKKPKYIGFADSLPKSAVGKILRRELAEPYWKGHERRVH